MTVKPESPGSPRLVRLLAPRRSLAAAALSQITPPWPLVPWLKKTSSRRYDWITFFSGYHFKRTPSFCAMSTELKKPLREWTHQSMLLYTFFCVGKPQRGRSNTWIRIDWREDTSIALPFIYTFASGAIAGEHSPFAAATIVLIRLLQAALSCLFVVISIRSMQQPDWSRLPIASLSSGCGENASTAWYCQAEYQHGTSVQEHRHTGGVGSSIFVWCWRHGNFSPRRLYRGILPPLMLEAPKRAVKCTLPSVHIQLPMWADI